MECRIVVGKTSVEFEVPDDLLDGSFQDLRQNAAGDRAASAFTHAYIDEVARIKEGK